MSCNAAELSECADIPDSSMWFLHENGDGNAKVSGSGAGVARAAS